MHRRAASRNSAMITLANESLPQSGNMSGTKGETDWWSDRHNIVVLVMLYAIQGIPTGFVFGSIPFLLKEKTGFDGIAMFSFAGWPYSLKLFIAPVVDSVYSERFGRRKSWIVPVQFASGVLFWAVASPIEFWVHAGDVRRLTPVFFAIMLFTATQDVAVDAWALTLLHPKNLPYASTCQSVGLSVGFFASFTVFLALQDSNFSTSYIRPWVGGSGSILSLSSMLQLVGCIYIVFTICIFLFKAESPASGTTRSPSPGQLLPSRSQNGSLYKPNSYRVAIVKTYRDLASVIQLPAIRQLLFLLLIVKTGFSAYDNVFVLKLLDLGFPKQTMAMMSVLQAPFSLIGSVVAGRLAAKHGPLFPYMLGFCLRYAMSLAALPLIKYFGYLNGVVTPLFFGLFLITSVSYSFGNDCLMFVSMGALFLSVSEQGIAGSYLTLLNTISNLGGMWHKPITLYLVDRLTIRTKCTLPAKSMVDGRCPIAFDGFTVLSVALCFLAIRVGIYAYRLLKQLIALPESEWRLSED